MNAPETKPKLERLIVELTVGDDKETHYCSLYAKTGESEKALVFSAFGKRKKEVIRSFMAALEMQVLVIKGKLKKEIREA